VDVPLDQKKAPGGSFRRRLFNETPLDFADVLGFQTLLALGHVKLDAVSLVQGLIAISLNRGEVYEYILAPVLGNETKTLLVLKPFHSSLCHAATTFLLIKFNNIPGAFRGAKGRNILQKKFLNLHQKEPF